MFSWAQWRTAATTAAVIEPPLFEISLERHKGQFATAARSLGIHRTTLRKKFPDQDQDND
jgi:DNA-binding protein Fis